MREGERESMNVNIRNFSDKDQDDESSQTRKIFHAGDFQSLLETFVSDIEHFTQRLGNRHKSKIPMLIHYTIE